MYGLGLLLSSQQLLARFGSSVVSVNRSCVAPLFITAVSGLVAFAGHIVGEKCNSSYGAGKLLVVTYIVGAPLNSSVHIARKAELAALWALTLLWVFLAFCSCQSDRGRALKEPDCQPRAGRRWRRPRLFDGRRIRLPYISVRKGT